MITAGNEQSSHGRIVGEFLNELPARSGSTGRGETVLGVLGVL